MSINKMILIEGLQANLNLDLNWLKPSEGEGMDLIIIASKSKEGTVTPIGVVVFNVENISKLRNFEYHFLSKNDGGNWIPTDDMLWETIPREFETNEIIGGFYEKDEVVF